MLLALLLQGSTHTPVAVTVGRVTAVAWPNQQGLATSGGAEGVGRRTTAAVVTTLFALILVDAGFTVLFHALKL